MPGGTVDLRNLGLALAAGLLVGVERGWSARGEQAGRRVAGLRTFGLLGLLGGAVGTIGLEVHPLLAIVVLAGAVAALLVGYARDMQIDGSVSATTTIAGFLTLCLGVLATNGYAALAVAAASAATLLLALRERLHGWVRGLSDTDIQATARFAILAGAVLPFLPDRSYGPYGAWNPRELWLVVILVTGFSFAAYVANRLVGPAKGTLATAGIGGLYSSTAVTAALSRRLRDTGSNSILPAGIALASAVMFVRVLILTALLTPFVLASVAAAVAPAAVVAVLLAAIAVRRSTEDPGGAVGDTNPIELLPALGFAAIVAMMALATRWAVIRYGDAGAGVLIAITGAFDVDAAIITLRGLPPHTLAADIAGLALATPVLLNTLFKAGVVVVGAGWSAGARAALPLFAAAATMAIGIATLAWRVLAP